MLLVKPPDRDTMLEVIAGLQSGELSRTEVVSWQMAVLNRFGNDLPLSVEDGLWYFHSFGFLDVPLVQGDSSTFFLRDMDFFEYQMDIEQVPANEIYEGVRRMRSHEVNISSVHWPLTTYRYTEATALDRLGLPTVRGTFEARGDMVEHLHLAFEGAIFLLIRQFDEYSEQAMILGTDRDSHRLEAFMNILRLETYLY